VKTEEIVGILLIAGATIDFIFIELPRITGAYTGSTILPGISLKEGGIIASLFDALIFFGGYLLFTK
jgi:hypothetical protein